MILGVQLMLCVWKKTLLGEIKPASTISTSQKGLIFNYRVKDIFDV